MTRSLGSTRTSLGRALQRYGWRGVLRRTPGAVERRLRGRVGQYTSPLRRIDGIRRSLRTRTLLRDGGLDRSSVVVIVDKHFGPQVIRKGTSDWTSYNRILVGDAYGFTHSVEPRTIVDMGAKAGYSAVFYHTRYPRARVIAVETDADEARVARINIALACGTGGKVAVEAGPAEDDTSSGVSMSALIDRHGMDPVDLVKIDVADDHLGLFLGDTKWLDRVNSIVIGLPDGDVRSTRESVTAALDHHFVDYDEVVRGEQSLFTRRHRLDELDGGTGD